MKYELYSTLEEALAKWLMKNREYFPPDLVISPNFIKLCVDTVMNLLSVSCDVRNFCESVGIVKYVNEPKEEPEESQETNTKPTKAIGFKNEKKPSETNE